jgi:sulfate permease, SulP family
VRFLRRDTLAKDAKAGLVLGVESVPDGLASGLLAGLNPVFGLYAYLFGTLGAAFATSSVLMTVQGTGAMAIIVADVDAVHRGADAETALFTLSILTGVIMITAGVLKLGSVLRFVSNAVMVGFINAVGVNIVLGQLDNFTGYAADGANRVTRALNSLLNIGSFSFPTVMIGVATVALIVLLERTPVGSMGLVVAIVLTSAAVEVFGLDSVLQLRDIADIPSSLPLPQLPSLRLVPSLLIPAASLAFVGLIQGAAITARFTNPDGTTGDASQDFIGQGVGNVASGFFRGMPVGGSMSGTSLVATAGAKSRQALFIAAALMALVVVIIGDGVGYIAMPALAALLMIIGVRTVRPHQIVSVAKVGTIQATCMVVTFALTMLIPLQYAVLYGVGLSVVLYVVRQSNRISVSRWTLLDDGTIIEGEAPPTVPPGEVVVLQPYGSLFFAAAPVFEQAIPNVDEATRHSVVIIRLRGRTDLGTTFMQVLSRYATELLAADSRLMIVSADPAIREQLRTSGVLTLVGAESIYERDERLGASVRQAHADARAWIAAHADPPQEHQ